MFLKRHSELWTENSVIIHVTLALADFLPETREAAWAWTHLLLTDLDLDFMSRWLLSPAGYWAQLAVHPSAFSEARAGSALQAKGCNTSAFQTARGMGHVPHGIAYVPGKAESDFIQSSFVNDVGLWFFEKPLSF